MPSVSFEELAHYERVRGMFEKGAKEEVEVGQGAGGQGVEGAGNGEESRRVAELMRRLANGGGGVVNGNGAGGNEVDEDEFVVRTGDLKLNGDADRSAPTRKGKGKGKGREVPIVDGDQGEDLYD